jgi:hypothetical protein
MSLKLYFQVKLKLNTVPDSLWKLIFNLLFLQLFPGSENWQWKEKLLISELLKLPVFNKLQLNVSVGFLV